MSKEKDLKKAARAQFEESAKTHAFDLTPANLNTRDEVNGHSPWVEYKDAVTGHRWAGYLEAWMHQQSNIEVHNSLDDLLDRVDIYAALHRLPALNLKPWAEGPLVKLCDVIELFTGKQLPATEPQPVNEMVAAAFPDVVLAKFVGSSMIGAIVQAQSIKPTTIVTGTSNWAAYIGKAVAMRLEADRLSPKNAKPAVNYPTGGIPPHPNYELCRCGGCSQPDTCYTLKECAKK